MNSLQKQAEALSKSVSESNTIDFNEAQKLVNTLAEILNRVPSKAQDSSRLTLPFPYSYSPVMFYTEDDFKSYYEGGYYAREYPEGYPNWINAGWQTSSEWKDC